jgi:hypothetical protein
MRFCTICCATSPFLVVAQQFGGHWGSMLRINNR